ncbi:heparin lyase I family protein [Kutzneria buriramensis]|uniref:Polysaccharide lyase-like protein n=1 Tax=Kutzneria buriramensis TaxID=1045776 RepID=A0A3E0HLM6_9PSEU|nr:heparin lyase I family protein [Kutzneria buriramensis]REH47298.1 polysaccharide lyase-like protein [Kutzneria buriramensis]
MIRATVAAMVVGLTAALSAPAAAAPQAALIWQADPSRGTSVFEGVETAPGTVSVVDDPTGRYGQSYRFQTNTNNGTKSRCESRGLRLPDGTVYKLDDSKAGQTFYVGWRSFWNPMPDKAGAWVALYQLHLDGAPTGGVGAGPFVLRTLGDGQLHFQLVSPDGSSRHIWNAPLKLNAWNTFVIGFKLSRSNSVGWVQFWYNGVQQTFTNGSTQYPGATLMGNHVNNKWGVYRSGVNSGVADAYLNSAKFGTTYQSVAP